MVEREDRRLAQRTAVAVLDLETLELASVAAAIEAMALLYVPAATDTNPDPAAGAPKTPPLAAAPAPGWHYEAPAGWAAQPWPLTMDGDWDEALEAGRSKRRESFGGLTLAADTNDTRSGRRASRKLRLGMDLLKMRINNLPVSFSGSLKGLKGFQVKATIKM